MARSGQSAADTLLSAPEEEGPSAPHSKAVGWKLIYVSTNAAFNALHAHGIGLK